MTDNERDTHFQGFAQLLYQDICDEFGTYFVGGEDLNEHEKQRWFDLIAQRAYDLVYHTLANTSQAMAAYCEHRPDIPENVLAIPDLTQWPSTEQER